MRARLSELIDGGPLGPFLWRPWYDRVSLPAVVNLVFPLSRAWAAADAAAASYPHDLTAGFRKALGPTAGDRPIPSAPTLAVFRRARQRYLDSEAALEAALFRDRHGPETPPAALVTARDKAAIAFMSQRSLFGLSHMRRRYPGVRFAVEPPAAVTERQAERFAAPAGAFALPAAPPRLRVSAPVTVDGVVRRYLRADGPAAADDHAPGPLRAVALVRAGTTPRAAVVLPHGIGMEEEFWGGYSSLTHWLLRAGVAVVLPEGPWHGRRRPTGRYGGEVVVARGPAGLIDYFGTHVPEIGRLIAWARTAWDRPVGLLGISLGALTGQIVLTAAAGWPPEARPDAALLVSPTDSVETTVFDGDLTRGIGAAEALAAAGWTRGDIARLRPLFQPADGALPALDPARIVVALGDVDRVVPYATGVARADLWNIPAANRFVRNQGHFALSLGLAAAPEPVERLVALLAEA